MHNYLFQACVEKIEHEWREQYRTIGWIFIHSDWRLLAGSGCSTLTRMGHIRSSFIFKMTEEVCDVLKRVFAI